MFSALVFCRILQAAAVAAWRHIVYKAIHSITVFTWKRTGNPVNDVICYYKAIHSITVFTWKRTGNPVNDVIYYYKAIHSITVFTWKITGNPVNDVIYYSIYTGICASLKNMKCDQIQLNWNWCGVWIVTLERSLNPHNVGRREGSQWNSWQLTTQPGKFANKRFIDDTFASSGYMGYLLPEYSGITTAGFAAMFAMDTFRICVDTENFCLLLF